MSNDEIDLFVVIQTSTIDLEEQKNARKMLEDLSNFSQDEVKEYFISAWELQFIDDLSIQNKEVPFTEKQLEHIDRLHTKFLVREEY
jgi:hypothetical protein